MRLVAEGTLHEPVHYSFVMGVEGGMDAKFENLIRLISDIPENSTWQCIAISRHQFALTVAAMCMGGNLRTGLEDNVYYKKGELAINNAQLVEKMVKIAKELGREIATIDETKEAFGIVD
jgi:3-keto-5-aminohexanoate cleavage enzyme